MYVDEFFDDVGENTNFIQEPADQYFCSVDENANLTESDKMWPLAKDENNEESNDVNAPGADILTGETADDGMMYFDAPTHNQLPIEDDFFIEIDDLLNRDDAVDASGFEMLDELLTYFDATNDNLHHVPPVSSSNLSECVDFNTNPVVPASEVHTAPMPWRVCNDCNNFFNGFPSCTEAFAPLMHYSYCRSVQELYKQLWSSLRP